jgi:hypothetical protein
MWKAMDKEDEANSRIKNYTNFAAYDNKLVRAQDIIQLAEESYDDIWMLIYDGPTAGAMTPGSKIWDLPAYSTTPVLRAYMYNPGKYTGNYKLKPQNYVSNTVPVLDSILSTVSTSGSTVAELCDSNSGDAKMYVRDNDGVHPWIADSTNNPSGNIYGLVSTGQYDAIQSLFLNNGNLNRLSRATGDNSISYEYGTGYYAPYLSLLVYDSDNTTDVVGVIFIREPSTVDPMSIE